MVNHRVFDTYLKGAAETTLTLSFYCIFFLYLIFLFFSSFFLFLVLCFISFVTFLFLRFILFLSRYLSSLLLIGLCVVCFRLQYVRGLGFALSSLLSTFSMLVVCGHGAYIHLG